MACSRSCGAPRSSSTASARRLIDEVDIITGVSGGSFTALAYALYGDRLFGEYEERFLKRDVQGALVQRALNPFNWWKYIGGSAGRSELAAEYYDEILFEGATFGDLLSKQGPVAVANGTDISTGYRLSFYQNDFDLLCSDLNKVRLSRAAATSSAVPVVLSAVTFNNYGGTCGYEYPAWVRSVAKAEGRVATVGARPAALPRDAGLREQQGSPVHPPRRWRRRGQHRYAQRAGGPGGDRREQGVPRRRSAYGASAGSCSSW